MWDKDKLNDLYKRLDNKYMEILSKNDSSIGITLSYEELSLIIDLLVDYEDLLESGECDNDRKN